MEVGKGRRETLVDFAEDDDAGEFGLGIAGDDWVVEVYSWDCSMDVSCLGQNGGGMVRMLPLPSAEVSTSWWVSLINMASFECRKLAGGSVN